MPRVLFILAALMMLVRPASAQTEEARLREAVKTGEIIRLHVIAAGDDEENQRIKLCVRDKVLSAWREVLRGQQNVEDMMDCLSKNRPAMEEAAQRAAAEEGFAGPVSAQVGDFTFPDRWYGSVLVPAGEYKALRIVLGEGKGKNWWCVLFPDLCLSLSSQDAPAPMPPTEVPQADVCFTWWLKDIFCAWPLLKPV